MTPWCLVPTPTYAAGHRITCRALVILALTGVAAAGCTKKSRSDAPSTPGGSATAASAEVPTAPGSSHAPLKAPLDITKDPTTVFQVTWGDSTVQMDYATVKQTLKSVSDNDAILVFAPSPAVQKLQAGSVLVMQGLAIKKVVGVIPTDSGIAVITEPGAIQDAVKDGHIHWEHDIDYTQYASTDPALPRDVPTMRAGLGAPDELGALAALWHWATKPAVDTGTQVDTATEGKDSTMRGVCGHGDTIRVNAAKLGRWDWCVYPYTSGGQFHMKTTLTNTIGGIQAELIGRATMGSFRTFSDLDIQSHSISNFTWSTKNIAGLFTLEWEIGKETPGVWAEEDLIPLPLGFEMPLVIGGLPLILEVSEGVMIHPGITGGKQISAGKFKLEYKGGSSLSFSKGQIDDHGKMAGQVEIPNTVEAPSVGALAMVVAIAAPRIELKLNAGAFWGQFKFLLPHWANTIPQIIALSPTGRAIMATPQYQMIQKAFSIVKSQGGIGDSALKSQAAAHIDFIMSAATFQSGTLVIVPCHRLQLIGTVTVGANAVALGYHIGRWQKNIWRDSTAFHDNASPTCE